jgi:hypothetical protein
MVGAEARPTRLFLLVLKLPRESSFIGKALFCRVLGALAFPSRSLGTRKETVPWLFPLFAFLPFYLFPGKLLPTYGFFASKMLASMPLWMNSGAARPAACIHSATSAWV